MNLIGPKTSCHANETLGYLSSVGDHAASLKSLKADPRKIVFAAIAAEASSLEVEMRVPPGGGIAIPTLKGQCAVVLSPSEPVTGDGLGDIDPAIRLTDHAKAYPRGRVSILSARGSGSK